MRAVNAVAPNLPPPTEQRRHGSETKPLYQWKYRHCRRGAPPAIQIADYSGVFFIFVPAPGQILLRDDIWRIDGLLTRNLYRNGRISTIRGKTRSTDQQMT
jgi:hypothetical protein